MSVRAAAGIVVQMCLGIGPSSRQRARPVCRELPTSMKRKAAIIVKAQRPSEKRGVGADCSCFVWSTFYTFGGRIGHICNFKQTGWELQRLVLPSKHLYPQNISSFLFQRSILLIKVTQGKRKEKYIQLIKPSLSLSPDIDSKASLAFTLEKDAGSID